MVSWAPSSRPPCWIPAGGGGVGRLPPVVAPASLLLTGEEGSSWSVYVCESVIGVVGDDQVTQPPCLLRRQGRGAEGGVESGALVPSPAVLPPTGRCGRHAFLILSGR